MSSSIGSYTGGYNEASTTTSDVPLEEHVDLYPLWVLPNLFEWYISKEVITILKTWFSSLIIFQAL